MNNNKLINIGLILGMVMSLILAISCVIYGIVIIINYFSVRVILIIFFGCFQIIPFLLCLSYYNYRNDEYLFLIALMSLFVFIIPGIVILIGYFRQKQQLLVINQN